MKISKISLSVKFIILLFIGFILPQEVNAGLRQAPPIDRSIPKVNKTKRQKAKMFKLKHNKKLKKIKKMQDVPTTLLIILLILSGLTLVIGPILWVIGAGLAIQGLAIAGCLTFLSTFVLLFLAFLMFIWAMNGVQLC